MTTWLFRGLAFAALMTVVRFIQGTLVNQAGTNSSLISIGLMALMTIPAFFWGLVDGRSDAKQNPDPDRRHDLAMRWILAGVIAGAVSGIACWFIAKMTVNMYAGTLLGEITTIAAFSALVIFLPAIIACSLGRWLVDRKTPYEGRRRVEGHEGNIFDKVQRDQDFLDDTRGYRIAPAVEAADSPETFSHTADFPYQPKVALAEREAAEDATEEITQQIREQAARIEGEIDDIQKKG